MEAAYGTSVGEMEKCHGAEALFLVSLKWALIIELHSFLFENSFVILEPLLIPFQW